MPRPLFSKRLNIWYCVWRPDGYVGKQKRKTFSFQKYGNPKLACEQFCRRLDAGQVINARLSIDAVIREYVRHNELGNRKRTCSIRSEAGYLKRFSTWAVTARIYRIDQIDAAALRKFQLYFFSGGTLAGKQPRGDRKNTWMHYVAALSGLFKFSIGRNWISENPVSAHEFKVTLQRKIPDRIYSGKELNACFRYIDQHYQSAAHSAYFRILAYTGARPSEVLALTWRQVNLAERMILLVITKSGRPRALPIAEPLLPFLKAIQRSSGSVIEPRRTVTHYNDIWSRSLAACGFPPGRQYDLRHTFATGLYLATKQLRWVQEMMGHSKITTTEIYTHVNPDHLRAAIKKLPY